MSLEESILIGTRLFIPLQQKFRQGFERDGFAFEGLQRGKRLGRQLLRNLP